MPMVNRATGRVLTYWKRGNVARIIVRNVQCSRCRRCSTWRRAGKRADTGPAGASGQSKQRDRSESDDRATVHAYPFLWGSSRGAVHRFDSTMIWPSWTTPLSAPAHGSTRWLTSSVIRQLRGTRAHGGDRSQSARTQRSSPGREAGVPMRMRPPCSMRNVHEDVNRCGDVVIGGYVEGRPERLSRVLRDNSDGCKLASAERTSRRCTARATYRERRGIAHDAR